MWSVVERVSHLLVFRTTCMATPLLACAGGAGGRSRTPKPSRTISMLTVKLLHDQRGRSTVFFRAHFVRLTHVWRQFKRRVLAQTTVALTRCLTQKVNLTKTCLGIPRERSRTSVVTMLSAEASTTLSWRGSQLLRGCSSQRCHKLHPGLCRISTRRCRMH